MSMVQSEMKGALGVGCQESNKVYLFMVEDCKRETLAQLIRDKIIQNLTIHSDQCSVYQCLLTVRYIHKTVNDSETFVAPDGTRTNTQ